MEKLRKAGFALLTAVVIIISVNAYSGVSAKSSGVGAMSELWEYRVEELTTRDFRRNSFNNLGKEGWELVSVIYNPGAFYPFILTFKRKLQ